MRYAVPDRLGFVYGTEQTASSGAIYLMALPDGVPVVLTGTAALIWETAVTDSSLTDPRGLADAVTSGRATEQIVADGYAYVGTVDTVLRGMEAQQKRQPVDWVFCYTYNSLIPHAVLMKSIETFWTKVMPRFR